MKKYTSKRGRSYDISVDPREMKAGDAAGQQYAVAVRTTGADPGNRRWLRLKDVSGEALYQWPEDAEQAGRDYIEAHEDEIP